MLGKLRELLPHKIRATSVHLALSMVVFLVVLYLILFHWYPGPWFVLDGGWQGVRIMIFVDLVLGPTLTFLIFNPAKTRLALGIDFGFIGVVQLSALIWGIYAVHSQRPMAIVFADDRFHSVDIAALRKQSLDAQSLQGFGKLPALVYFEWPEEPEKRIELSMKTITSGIADHEQVEFLRPVAAHFEEIFAKQVDLTTLLKEDTRLRKKLDRKAEKQGLSQAEDLRYLRFSGRFKEATLIFTPDGKLIGSLPIELEPVTASKPSPAGSASRSAPG
ncbi:MAG: hypothetical protein ACRETN_14680 [Nevskiales bacterium]